MTDPRAQTQRCAWLLEHLNLEVATDEEGAAWEPMQLDFLNDTSIMRVDNKSRQGGGSWVASAEAVAVGCLQPRTTTEIIAYNREASKESIRYARAVIEGLHPSVRPRLVVDNAQGVELDNGSRIIALPGKPPRGKKSRKVWDEAAHCVATDLAIFRGILGGLARGGVARVISTPLGLRGMFHKLCTSDDFERDWIRHSWPWWTWHGLCVDVERARIEAPGMDPDERVEVFGSPRLRAIRSGSGSDLEGWAQEYECAFVDDAGAFIPLELVTGCELDFTPEVHGDGQVFIGFDVGRRRDLSAVIGIQKGQRGARLCLLEVWKQMPFPEQEDRLTAILERLRPARVAGDYTGMGGPIVERLQERFGKARVEAVTFTGAMKEDLATGLKAALERRHVTLPVERALRSDITSIRQTRTPAGNYRYDGNSEDGHADRAWALAIHAAGPLERSSRGVEPELGGERTFVLDGEVDAWGDPVGGRHDWGTEDRERLHREFWGPQGHSRYYPVKER